MPGKIHEFRDPIHVFVRLDSDERRVMEALEHSPWSVGYRLTLLAIVLHSKERHNLLVARFTGKLLLALRRRSGFLSHSPVPVPEATRISAWPLPLDLRRTMRT